MDISTHPVSKTNPRTSRKPISVILIHLEFNLQQIALNQKVVKKKKSSMMMKKSSTMMLLGKTQFQKNFRELEKSYWNRLLKFV